MHPTYPYKVCNPTTFNASKHHTYEITETATALYAKIAGQLPKKLEYTLYSVLQAMIDAYSDEENKYNRLIEMINRNTSTETIERFESIEIMQNDLKIANNNLKIANNNLEAAQEDYKIAQNRIQELEEKVKELEEQLNSE